MGSSIFRQCFHDFIHISPSSSWSIIKQTIQVKFRKPFRKKHLQGFVGETSVALIQVRWPSALPHVGSNWHVHHAWIDSWMDRLKDRWMIETLWLWYIWITLFVLLGRFFFWLGKAEFSFFDTFLPLHCYHWCRCDRGHVCMAGGFRRMRLSTGSPPSGTLSFQNMLSGRLKLLFFDMDTATLDENDNYYTVLLFFSFSYTLNGRHNSECPTNETASIFIDPVSSPVISHGQQQNPARVKMWNVDIAATWGMWEHDLEVNHSPAVPGFKDWHAAQQKMQGKTRCN